MRIGILVTNTDTAPFTRNYPEDGLKFSTLIKAARPDWEVKIYQVKDGQFPVDPDECDGYLIGGSPSSVNDNEEWIAKLLGLIRTLHSRKTPTVGMCFGHQAIAKALGGEVGQNPDGWGWGVAETRMQKFPDWIAPKANTIRLYAAHSEQVTRLPQGAEVIGGSDFCPVGSFIVGEHVFTTEYHPEISQPFFIDVTKAFAGYIGEDVASKALAQADIKTDNALFMEWVAKFFEFKRKRS